MTESTALAPRPDSLLETDYDAICAAVMETERGRWFLAEYARRNRHADTMMVLSAVDRLEARLRDSAPAPASFDRFRVNLVDMAQAIARTKSEIASIKPDAEHHGKIGDATEELDAIVKSTEVATSAILGAAEQIQELAWTLREQGLDGKVCDELDAKATEIYTACSFQDLTGQRIGKVIEAMRFLEKRINAMIEIWGGDDVPASGEPDDSRPTAPPHDGAALDQSDIDMVMGQGARPALRADIDGLDADILDISANQSRTADIDADGEPPLTIAAPDRLERPASDSHNSDDDPGAPRLAAPGSVERPTPPGPANADGSAEEITIAQPERTRDAAHEAPLQPSPRVDIPETALRAKMKPGMTAVETIAALSAAKAKERSLLTPARAALMATITALAEEEKVALFT